MPNLTNAVNAIVPIRESRRPTPIVLSTTGADASFFVDGDQYATVVITSPSASTVNLAFFGLTDTFPIPIPFYQVPTACVGGTISPAYTPLVTETIAGMTRRTYSVKCGQFKEIRVSTTTVPSVAITVAFSSDAGVPLNPFATQDGGAVISVVGTAAVSLAAAVTVPAVAGLRAYITSIRVTRYATALVTATAAGAQLITTTLQGNPSISAPTGADAASSLVITEKHYRGRGAAGLIGATVVVTAPLIALTIQAVTVDYYYGL